MSETLVPADVEVDTVTELTVRMPLLLAADSFDVGTRIPNPRPAEFGRVLSVGGQERDLVTDTALITLEGFATSETRAQRICAFMVAAVQAAARAGRLGSTPCYRATVAALPANLPMPTVPDRFRFTATVSVDLRRSAV